MSTHNGGSCRSFIRMHVWLEYYRKLSTLTVDNCSTNDSMIAIVLDKICYTSLILDGCLFHMCCCTHILNMVVRDGLDVIKKSIEKIRYSVAYWLGTQKREEKFIETAK